jgi:hypothetical protein
VNEYLSPNDILGTLSDLSANNLIGDGNGETGNSSGKDGASL